MSDQTQLDRIEARQARIESLLVGLLEAMAEDVEEPALRLDGLPAGDERDQLQPL